MASTFLQYFSSIAAVIGLSLYFRRRRAKQIPLPPGPKRWPLLGNLLQLPTSQEWETFHKWCKELDTDILYLNAAGTHLIILDTLSATSDVFDKNTVTCSSRPRLPMVRELLGWEESFILMDYGDTWRLHRKLFSQEMSVEGSKRFRPHQDRACRRLLKRFATLKSVDLWSEIRHVAGEISLSVAYGFDVKSKDDYWLGLVEDATAPVVEAFTPGAFLVDAFPILKYVPNWFPGASFKRKAAIGFKKREHMFRATYTKSKEALESGVFAPSFVGYSLERDGPQTKHDRDIECVAGSIYTAAGDTTFSLLTGAVHILLNHPEAVKRAQKEMDDVLGSGQLPTYEDESSLPVTSSLIKEIQRWRIGLPLALPHLATEEVIYKGYRIPRGSIVMGNAWGIMRDEKHFEEPYLFKPDRYLSADGKSINKDIMDPSVCMYGFGRRICPGRYLAAASVWNTLSSLIAAFNFHHEDGQGGLDWPMRIGCLNMPASFKMRFEPRSKEIEELITQYQD